MELGIKVNISVIKKMELEKFTSIMELWLMMDTLKMICQMAKEKAMLMVFNLKQFGREA